MGPTVNPANRAPGPPPKRRHRNVRGSGPQERLQQRHDLEHGAVREHLLRFFQ